MNETSISTARPAPAGLTRRELAGSLLAGIGCFTVGGRLLGRPLTPSVDHQSMAKPLSARRRYRADAVILLFGLPIFRRSGVGTGYTAISESLLPDGSSVTMNFGAGSTPERTRGLNRQGFICETFKERDGSPFEASYWGALVSSSEEDLDSARQSLSKPAKDSVSYTAIDGHHRPGHSRSALARFAFPTQYTWAQRQALFEAARTSFPPEVHWRDTDWPGERSTPATFLGALRQAIEQPGRTAVATYVYSEKRYRLQVEKFADGKTGREFKDRALIDHPEHIVCVKGRTLEEKSGKQSTFQLWVERPSTNPLPLRFEYQPKSFLRLAFEFDPSLPTAIEQDGAQG